MLALGIRLGYLVEVRLSILFYCVQPFGKLILSAIYFFSVWRETGGIRNHVVLGSQSVGVLRERIWG